MGIILIVVRDSYKSTKMYCRNVNNLISAQYYWVDSRSDITFTYWQNKINEFWYFTSGSRHEVHDRCAWEGEGLVLLEAANYRGMAPDKVCIYWIVDS